MRLTIEAAARQLEAGAVVAYPTETVYGLGCDVRDETAIAALCALKGRDAERGISILLPSVAALDEILVTCAEPLRAEACALARAFWPGPLTLVLSGPRATFPLVATAQGVAFRCSPHPQAAALARVCAAPVASTSANRTGEPPAADAEQVESIFGADFPVAGGMPAGGALPSTVVALEASGQLVLLREGAIPFAQVRARLAAQPVAHARVS